jgi:hypothetical protein
MQKSLTLKHEADFMKQLNSKPGGLYKNVCLTYSITRAKIHLQSEITCALSAKRIYIYGALAFRSSLVFFTKVFPYYYEFRSYCKIVKTLTQ